MAPSGKVPLVSAPLWRTVPRTVLMLGLASFLTDCSSEMIFPLLPAFVSTVLAAGALELGAIEGLAESTSAMLKIVSGWWADRTRRRKPLILAGYGLSGLVRPMVGLAGGWTTVLAVRFLDRIGKGVRTSPRDAWIADVTAPEQRGAAYGLHRSMDHAGAVVGPLVAALLLGQAGLDLRTTFLLASIPALLAWLVLAFGTHESADADPEIADKTAGPPATESAAVPMERGFPRLLWALAIASLGRVPETLLILRVMSADVDPVWTTLLWAVYHVVKMVATYHLGKWVDRRGGRLPTMCAWTLQAALYLVLGWMTPTWAVVLGFLGYGVVFGLEEPAQRAWVAALAPSTRRGVSFGWYHGVVGLTSLPAGLLCGWLWQASDPATAFVVGAGLSLGGVAVLLVGGPPAERRPVAAGAA